MWKRSELKDREMKDEGLESKGGELEFPQSWMNKRRAKKRDTHSAVYLYYTINHIGRFWQKIEIQKLNSTALCP